MMEMYTPDTVHSVTTTTTTTLTLLTLLTSSTLVSFTYIYIYLHILHVYNIQLLSRKQIVIDVYEFTPRLPGGSHVDDNHLTSDIAEKVW